MKQLNDLIEIDNALGTIKIYVENNELILENLVKVSLGDLQVGNYVTYLTGKEIFRRFPHLKVKNPKLGEKFIRDEIVYTTVILEDIPSKKDPVAHYYFFENRVEALNFISTLGDIWLHFKHQNLKGL